MYRNEWQLGACRFSALCKDSEQVLFFLNAQNKLLLYNRAEGVKGRAISVLLYPATGIQLATGHVCLQFCTATCPQHCRLARAPCCWAVARSWGHVATELYLGSNAEFQPVSSTRGMQYGSEGMQRHEATFRQRRIREA